MATSHRLRWPFYVGGHAHARPVPAEVWRFGKAQVADLEVPVPLGGDLAPEAPLPPPALYTRRAVGVGDRVLEVMQHQGSTDRELLGQLFEHLVGAALLWHRDLELEPEEALRKVQDAIEEVARGETA